MSSTRYDNQNFKPKKEVLRTMRLEDFEDSQKVLLADLHEDTCTQLEGEGVKELMPVQQVTYKLFIEGSEIVVK